MTGLQSTRLIGTSEARDLRNQDDYDDWEVGLEPIPGDTHWVRVRTLTQLYRHLIYVFATSDTISSSHCSQPGDPRDSQVETHGSHPVAPTRPELLCMNYDEYYRASRNYSWNDMRQLRSQPKPASTTVPEVFKHRFSEARRSTTPGSLKSANVTSPND
jgi:hypothetical protein